MPLDIHVEAEPESMFDFARWLRDAGSRVRFWADAGPTAARAESQGGWTGDAAEGFRAVAYQLGAQGETLSFGWDGVAETTEAHAQDIIVVRNKMGDARDIASRAGLPCTDREISDPGMPPEKPELGIDGESAKDALAKADAWKAWHAWNDKNEAYTKAATLVTEARRIEQDSQNTLLDVVGGMADYGPIITMTDAAIGIAAASAESRSNWNDDAKKFTSIAKEARLAAGDSTLPSSHRSHELVQSLVAQAKAQVAETRANSNHIGRWVERLPPWAKVIIAGKLGDFIPKNASYLAKAPGVLKKISVAGGGLSVVATINEIKNGKNPATTVVSNGSGLLAGTAAGMVAGGPLGAVAGFIIGTGTTIIVDDLMTPDPEDVHTIAPGATAHYPGQGR